MKAIQQYFPVELFIMLYKVVLTVESVDEILTLTIKKKATEWYFNYDVQGGSNFESVNLHQRREHSNESYWDKLCAMFVLLFEVVLPSAFVWDLSVYTL